MEAAESDRKTSLYKYKVQYMKNPQEIYTTLCLTAKSGVNMLQTFTAKYTKQPTKILLQNILSNPPTKKRLSNKVGLPIIHPRFPMLFAASEIHSKQVVSIAQQRALFSLADSSFPHGKVESHVFFVSNLVQKSHTSWMTTVNYYEP